MGSTAGFDASLGFIAKRLRDNHQEVTRDMDGRMQFEQCGVRDFLSLFSINRVSLVSHPMQKVLRRVSHTLRRLQQSNPIGTAQKNVAHHYDLGNDFYRLFLDEGNELLLRLFSQL